MRLTITCGSESGSEACRGSEEQHPLGIEVRIEVLPFTLPALAVSTARLSPIPAPPILQSGRQIPASLNNAKKAIKTVQQTEGIAFDLCRPCNLESKRICGIIRSSKLYAW